MTESRSREDAAREVFGRRASHYTTSEVHSDSAALEALVDLARPELDWRVLDVGTGTGHTALAFAARVREVVGLDLTPEMLAEAQSLAAKKGVGNLELIMGDVHHLGFENCSFNLVTCRRAAHHFSNISLAISEMERVLKPGGLLLIEDRSIPEDDFVDACMNELDVLHDPSHVRQYRQSEWQRLASASGLAVRHVSVRAVSRALTALTADVPSMQANQIREIVSELPREARMTMDVKTVDGQVHINHWFITLLAEKAR